MASFTNVVWNTILKLNGGCKQTKPCTDWTEILRTKRTPDSPEWSDQDGLYCFRRSERYTRVKPFTALNIISRTFVVSVELICGIYSYFLFAGITYKLLHSEWAKSSLKRHWRGNTIQKSDLNINKVCTSVQYHVRLTYFSFCLCLQQLKTHITYMEQPCKHLAQNIYIKSTASFTSSTMASISQQPMSYVTIAGH